MENDIRVWAVDVSTFRLWDSDKDDKKGEDLIKECLPIITDQDKVRRYVREIDQIRCFTGKLLAHLAVCQTFTMDRNDESICWKDIQFENDRNGRPFLAFPKLPFDYNITHDGDWVAIVFTKKRSLDLSPPNHPSLGIDVMEIQLPSFEKDVNSFVETMEITLTENERRWILEAPVQDGESKEAKITQSGSTSANDLVRLERLYTLWTFKEAFTKAHGVGLSFDFARIELKMWNRNSSNGNSILTISEPKSRRDQDDQIDPVTLDTQKYNFHQIRLPPGKIHQTASQFNSTEQAGKGTGKGSLLVVCSHQTELQKTMIPPSAISFQQAEKDGLLQIWTLEELVLESKRCFNEALMG